VIGTARIERSTARGARISTSQVGANTERIVAIATIHSMGGKLGFGPYYGRVASSFFMAVNAAIKGVTALEAQGNNIALAMVVRALSTSIHIGASQ
jgi:hypothetical protein